MTNDNVKAVSIIDIDSFHAQFDKVCEAMDGVLSSIDATIDAMYEEETIYASNVFFEKWKECLKEAEYVCRNNHDTDVMKTDYFDWRIKMVNDSIEGITHIYDSGLKEKLLETNRMMRSLVFDLAEQSGYFGNSLRRALLSVARNKGTNKLYALLEQAEKQTVSSDEALEEQ